MARRRIPDIDIHEENMNAHVHLSGFSDKMDEAQIWAEEEIVKRMLPVIPRKSGNLLGEIQAANSSLYGSGYVRVAQSYGVYLYEGYRTVKNGDKEEEIPFNWTNPQTQPRWGHYTIETYRSYIKDGVKRILRSS